MAIITMQSSTRAMRRRRRRRRKGNFQIVFRSTRRKGTKREAQKSKNASPVETKRKMKNHGKESSMAN